MDRATLPEDQGESRQAAFVMGRGGLVTRGISVLRQVRLNVKKEVMHGVDVSQKVELEFVVKTFQCDDCNRSFTEQTWKALVQVNSPRVCSLPFRAGSTDAEGLVSHVRSGSVWNTRRPSTSSSSCCWPSACRTRCWTSTSRGTAWTSTSVTRQASPRHSWLVDESRVSERWPPSVLHG